MTELQMKYFVLKPKGASIHAAASRAAMREYANVMRETDPAFSNELTEWANREAVEIKRDPFPDDDNMNGLE
jgi:hypothetical protein